MIHMLSTGGLRKWEDLKDIKQDHEVRTITSQWVVPYHAQLLEAFSCHLSVEICSSIKLLRYIIKYAMRGIDKAVFALNREDLTQYLTGRYTEVVAAILGF